ncbi:HNH endonuclease [Mycobacterium phage LilPharaoh]|uniref:HNH endonuclease n=1 Tax=Mycobacterium phage Amelie TaxID=1913035 RepID=A0A1J0GPZ1_9CAUD|nr:HNH endonuclease [Mycobacterium phage Enkosi]YP_009952574.1 HNH endonuclease [Mycobacterium phage Amelie]ATN90510.1 HNH endonuclease [Mycobacterium phage LilPharaoh]AVP42634.1 HNH endonuclease [Mycobacterium phage SgtBeansprout]AXC37162.1 HNH endonuclease [Mycobacterium phage Biglebops]QGJ93341.1 HNH endonuclease [Mycobacterium phage Mdavu]UQS94456.1 HNH endonuclease [Mycobacterium phage Nutello]UXE03219.1 HNH endonuclease [Mycobacterium phage Nikao]
MNTTALFDRIALTRADGRCECEGDCGRSHRFGIHYRCANSHGRPAVHGVDKVVQLAVVHLDGDDRNLDERNLLAMCQSCAKRHRATLKAAAEKAAERAAREAEHDGLFDVPELAADTGSRPTL